MHKRKYQVSDSWRMDETYIKVGGKDRYLYRAVDKYGNTVDFLLTRRRQTMSAQKFFNKAIGNNVKPRVINIDKSGANYEAVKVVSIIRKNQIEGSGLTTFKTFYSLAA